MNRSRRYSKVIFSGWSLAAGHRIILAGEESVPLSEADTCRKYVVPRLQAAGWDDEPHSIAEQRTITDGRIVPVGKGFVRKPPRRAG